MDDYILIVTFAFMAYGITRHHLLDIEVIIKKTLVFAGLFAVVAATVSGVTALTQGLVGQFLKIPMPVTTALSVAVAIFLYEPTKKFFLTATDKFLFQKKEDIRRVLGRLSEEAVRIFEMTELSAKILGTLRESLRLESAAIMLRSADGKKFSALNTFGTEASGRVFAADDLLLQFLAESGKILNFENPEQAAGFPVEIQTTLAPFKAVIVIPLFLQNELTGVLFLGKKLSDQEFSAEELEAFPTMANQIAIGLNFARKLSEEKQFYAQMAQQAKMVSLGTMSTGVAHEMGNALNNIRGMVQTFGLWQKMGAWPKFSEDEKAEHFKEIAAGVETNVVRAQGIMSRLNALAKNPDELAAEPVDLNESVKNGVWFTEKDLEWAQITLKKHFAPDLPKAMANDGVIAQAMMNLVMNAKDAIKMKPSKNGAAEITVTTFNRAGKVGVKIGDTGVGIPPGNADKIFDPFFTTKDVSRNPAPDAVKGTGLGLFLVKRLIEHCGGEISVESKPGEGAEFTIVFPKAELTTDGR